MDTQTENVIYAAAVLIGLITVPSVVRLVRGPWRIKVTNNDGLYEDEDGKATEESMTKYSIKTAFISISITTALGLAASFAQAVFLTVKKDSASTTAFLTKVWLQFAVWVLLLIQFVDTSRQVQLITRYHSAISRLASTFLLEVLAITIVFGDLPRDKSNFAVTVSLTGTQALLAVAIIVALFAIPRRPDVFRPDGTIVERQRTASLWKFYTFNWSSELLDVAAKKLIEIKDLPALDANLRSKESTAKFRSTVLKDTVPLWKILVWAFRFQLLRQWILVALSTIFDVAPQFAMLKLLQYLEARDKVDAIDPKAWLCVFGLFFATLASTLIDYRVTWLMWSDLAIPMRSILTGLVFEKMMKTKDCTVPPEAEEKKEDKSKTNGAADPADPPKEEKKEAPRQSQQDVVNMFAVDTNTIAVLGATNQFYVMFVFKLVISVVFLWLLVGWQSLLAGMLSIALLFPINQAVASRYSKYQKILMKARDKKTAIITEALQGIRQIKFSAIETQWAEKIGKVREEELETLWENRINNIYMMLGSDTAPILLTAFSLATYAYIKGTLLPSVAFTALGVFIQLEGLLGMLPFLLVMGVNAKVSCERIEKFMHLPEKPENTYPGDSISFHNVSVSFPTVSEDPQEDRFVLRDIDLDFPNNALSVISGPTGAGKSLLLAAILGEVEVLSGYIRVPRPPPADQRFDDKATAADWIIPTAIAFVSQTPWIENATIKNNILFGLPHDPVRYGKVLKACALTADLAMFDDGDETEVGAQGISLSGGQKWRLTLARAFYSRAGILVLDDVFSALDSHVGKDIYDNALMGELAEGRTRILVTHHVALTLPRAKYAVRLSARGVLEHAGLIEDLRQTGSFENILKAEQGEEVESKDSKDDSDSADTSEGSTLAPADGEPPVAKAAPKKLVEDEERETGSVKRSVYAGYLKATGGIPFWIVIFLIYSMSEGSTLARSYWIKIWTGDNEKSSATTMHVAHSNTYSMQTQLFSPHQNASEQFYATSTNHTLGYYLLVYVLISLVSVLVGIGRFYILFRGALVASRNVFKQMTHSVLHTPLRWLDTVPTGRILNRFTADFQSMDSQLSQNFGYLAGCFLQIIGILAAAFFVSPYIIILALVLLMASGRIAYRYLQGARSIKRLESIQKSPMISHFSASLSGLSTIRAFAKSPEFITRMYGLIDSFNVVTWHNWLFNNWVGFRMSLVGSVFASSVAAFIISTKGIDASLAGFALAFALDYATAVKYTIRLVANTELDMNAAERIFEYRDLEVEKEGGAEDLRASWPEEGKVEVKDLEVGYAEGLPSILKGLTFTAERNQRIGVVGRTGAGKSTLSLALFRFLEARGGSITIDGIDISGIKLHDLRTRLAIIPQDPVLFSGTIRSNLDPFDQFSDVQLREALQRVHLVPSADSTPVPELVNEESTATSSTVVEQGNTNIFLSLTSPIASSGSNLSQGQKQLLCLARAILSRPKVLLLDEATSAVDMATDTLIQRSIREEFANTTLLVVAHRLSTVADFDRILVMRDGVAAEFGSPKELLERDDGVFKSMVGQSGEKDDLELKIRES
ncbi:ABC transporter [Phlyctema vagabunda]|uniref:ABC transporter n=1 Tax=Phlyctema vagabunda TaxID=108571 RepID=A0ABR4P9F2_9HELO